MTCRLSIPGLMTLRATWRCTGWVCSARKTVPMPPSPSCWSSLYGPITVPGPAPRGGSAMVGAAAGASRKLPVRWCCSSNLSRRSRRAGLPAHTRSRKAARSAGTSFSRASMKRDCSCMAVTSTPLRVWFCISMRRWAAQCARNPEEKTGPGERRAARPECRRGLLSILFALFALALVQFLRPAQVFQCFVLVALGTEGASQVTMRLCKILLELQGLAVGRHRFRQLPLELKGIAQVEVGIGDGGVELDGDLQGRLRLDQLVLHAKGNAQVVVGSGIVRLEFGDFAEGLFRLGQVPLPGQGGAEVIIGLGVIVLEFDGLAEGLLRLGRPVLL